ncbi:hypothetical protein VC83_03625 [Pseudogymnoascus destructans]|uniref:Uncharacterized protein n=2 Tax=Pseudogymnoascus destructans TaxID=655981 RepID=L8FWX2_PSED2|nr:uncharacterized protein VC83_03625 [Pseudogymnoascus destructans]ELR05460.1 hypothetical protein GMDG_01755 [Pseudogymnoascus destructans 20631-21]OAF60455.2 hypothetical protein VC83_03625 [Pseudogymnoascus destructans]
MFPPMNEAPAATGDVMGSTSVDRASESSCGCCRMVKAGYVVYLGNSASRISIQYEDSWRTIGPCNVTNDGHKGKVVEESISTGLTPTYVLPDKEAADFLLKSFFSNVTFNFPPGTPPPMPPADCGDNSHIGSRAIHSGGSIDIQSATD